MNFSCVAFDKALALHFASCRLVLIGDLILFIGFSLFMSKYYPCVMKRFAVLNMLIPVMALQFMFARRLESEEGMARSSDADSFRKGNEAPQPWIQSKRHNLIIRAPGDKSRPLFQSPGFILRFHAIQRKIPQSRKDGFQIAFVCKLLQKECGQLG